MFIIGAAGYFTYSKFQNDISSATASPSPSASSSLEFAPINSPSPSGQTTQNQQQTNPRPYEINKDVGKFPGVLNAASLQNKKVVIQTNKGVIEIEVFPDSPMAASNFLILSDTGFYDGLKFHRVEDWLIQGGDPKGDGTGGPGYEFADEKVTRSYTRGIVAMANAGPNTNGSQFFILKKDTQLPPNYTIFGNVVTGMDVVDKITVGDVMQKVTVQPLKP